MNVRREIAKIGTYIERAYMDRMENKITEEFWLDQTRRWQEQRATLQTRVTAMETSGPDSYLSLARKVLEPTISLADKYFSMDPHKRATILRITCSNLKQDQKKIVPTYRTIYGFLARGNDSGNWLPASDAGQTQARTEKVLCFVARREIRDSSRSQGQA